MIYKIFMGWLIFNEMFVIWRMECYLASISTRSTPNFSSAPGDSDA